MSILSNAVSGLNSYHRALSTVSHNIANVNTEGYTRQAVELTTQAPQLVAGAFDGRGVSISNISRVFDQFLFDQTLSRNSNFNESDTFLAASQRLDATIGEPSTSLTGPLQSFFNAIQDVASNPTSMSARQVAIAEGENIADRFSSLNQQLNELKVSTNAQMSTVVTRVNTLAESLSDVNIEIARATGTASGSNVPNDLLDHRDRLVSELSTLTDVSTSVAIDNTMSVFIGTGQALVIGTDYNPLAMATDQYDVSEQQIVFASGNQSIPITNQLTGGIIGGLSKVKDEIITPSQNAQSRIAINISNSINTQHQAGVDINGVAGGLFFNDVQSLAPSALASSNNNAASGTVSASITSPAALTTSDYQLNYDGTNFSLLRLSDNTVVDSSFSVGDLPRTVASEGFSISLTGSVAAGDRFKIQPTKNAAGQIGMQLSDPETFAAAANGTAAGNNDNALLLAGLQNTRSVANNSATFQEAFAGLISDISVQTNQLRSTRAAQEVLLAQAQEAHTSVSGVNLDEEAANLLRYQQAYQASARVISVADEIFQSLLSAVG